ncbi:DNA cytosine methyltransferase [Caulobacter segnis]|uniref:DNA cytosine methyltransferase n=1 Tax=Caulobacter segnis TaxID=88688 RepID=UPI00240F67BC|nr:DNA cytosine methyltransferase [Caulobacter segnis]MDG2521658.1 DNA cytosine methyltransferase [Caulobacter segnis]
MNRAAPFSFYEFFAGGGMARLGLGDAWACLFANDFDPLKARTYRENFPDAQAHMHEGDVWAVEPSALPGRADLAWASSPCQDFSLAGGRAGLNGGKSSAFFGFWRLMETLDVEGRAPGVLVIENVSGLLTSNGGRDFRALCEVLAARGYKVGALEIDAAAFAPQSRPRIFVIAARHIAPHLLGASPFQTEAVRAAHNRLPESLKDAWAWWSLPAPPARNADLASILEPDDAVNWRAEADTEALLAMMAPLHRARVEKARSDGGRAAGAVFRRMRGGVQRAEVRFDGLAGCLRTPRGGSSRQTVLVVDNGQVRSRLITAREAARLMGLPEDYCLPKSQSGGLHVMGDGVAVPVVRWLAEHLLEPLAAGPRAVAAE